MSADREVLIRGDGVAACCCVHLLKTAGVRVGIQPTDRPRVPAIMLGDSAVALMRDVFGRPSLFDGLPRINQRLVAWGEAAKPASVPHSGIVVSESLLLEILGEGLQPDSVSSPAFTIETSRPLPPNVREHQFGSRRASAGRAWLRPGVDSSACAIESFEDGWLFLIPNGTESTWLLGVGGAVQSLLDRSRLIAALIDRIDAASGGFPGCPRILSPLAGQSWIACGTVAVGFDPICGDGTAQAVREAILAAAVVRGILDGGDADSLLLHYETRLISGMMRHLQLCTDFYRTGGSGQWWKKELDALLDGSEWCASMLAKAGEPSYKLSGFDLILR